MSWIQEVQQASLNLAPRKEFTTPKQDEQAYGDSPMCPGPVHEAKPTNQYPSNRSPTQAPSNLCVVCSRHTSKRFEDRENEAPTETHVSHDA